MSGIPPAVAALAERAPVEDFALALLRSAIPDIAVVTQIQKDQEFPAILVRRLPAFIYAQTDERWIEQADVAIHTFAEDPDGDHDAAVLAEAVRVVLRDAWLDNYGDDTLGWLAHFGCLAPPRRVSDWATASGPVQYADLPSNLWRYEGRYRLSVRKPRNHPYPLPP